jgi:FAD-dependent monooxygenase
MATHFNVKDFLQPDAAIVNANSEEGAKMRKNIHDHYQANDGENKDLGIEMGHRYRSEICIPDNEETIEPEWLPSRYIPTTWPGSRAPHVFLKDGSAIYDLLGKGYTLVEFARSSDADDGSAGHLVSAANADSVFLSHLKLFDEDLASRLWEKRLVIVRPDMHVAWRGNDVSPKRASEIIRVIAGIAAPKRVEASPTSMNGKAVTFSMVLNEVQDKEYRMGQMGALQQ